MSLLPSKQFFINYNAKKFNSSNNSIPKTSGQLFNEDLVLNNAPSSVASDHITLDRRQYMVKDFGSIDSNMFNRSGSDSLTVICKTTKSADDDTISCMLGNRQGTTNMNWMVMSNRGQEGNDKFILHNQNETFETCPSVQIVSEPNIIAFVVNNGQGYGKSYTDGTTTASKSVSWGSNSRYFGFFADGNLNAKYNEFYCGDFYWMYVSPEALTDEEILQVIEYNESDFSASAAKSTFNATGGTTTITVSSSGPWTASTESDWITLSQMSGEGSASINCTVAANDTAAERTATITFTDGSAESVVTIRQKVASTGGQPLYLGSTEITILSLGDKSVELAFLGAVQVYSKGAFAGLKVTPSISLNNVSLSRNISIKSSEDWTITTDADWLSFSQTTGTGDGSRVMVIVTATETEEERTATITVTTASYSAECTVEDSPIMIPFDEIWYTSTDGAIISPRSGTMFYDADGNRLTYTNTYVDGKGIYKFSGEIAYWTGSWFYNFDERLVTIGLPASLDKAKMIPDNIGISFYQNNNHTVMEFFGDYEGIGENGAYLLGGNDFHYFLSCANGYDGDIVIPEGVSYIEGYAFKNSQAASITVPSSLTYIDAYAFEQMTTRTIYMKPTTPPEVYDTNIWMWVGTGGTVYYPNGADYSSFYVPSGWDKIGYNFE